MTYLRLAGRIVVVRRLARHLLEHLMEAHEDLGIPLDQGLEVLDHRMELIVRLGVLVDRGDLTTEPGVEDPLVVRHPSAYSMLDVMAVMRRVMLLEYIYVSATKGMLLRRHRLTGVCFCICMVVVVEPKIDVEMTPSL